jgi:hypothetical protein
MAAPASWVARKTESDPQNQELSEATMGMKAQAQMASDTREGPEPAWHLEPALGHPWGLFALSRTGVPLSSRDWCIWRRPSIAHRFRLNAYCRIALADSPSAFDRQIGTQGIVIDASIEASSARHD